MRSYLVRLTVICCALTIVLPGGSIDACTSFLLKHANGPVMAKNFDWDVAAGLLVVNPRGLAKRALVGDGEKPVRWTSRYGSVTFNQYGREFPQGGMNEAGLAMEVLWLAESEYPAAGDRESVGTLQWIQYCLDSFRTIDDVVASASELAFTDRTPLHFLACDKTTTCAVIEFLGGKLVERNGRTLPLPVLTNDTYSASLTYLNRTLGYGGDPVTPEGTGSLARYARAANGVHGARSDSNADPVESAFAILGDVAQPDSTQWSIVYELTTGRIHFTSSTNKARRTIDLNALDLDCTADPLVIDLAARLEGDITAKLVPYTIEANQELVEAGFSAKELTPPSDETIQAMVAYPDGLLCTFSAAGGE